MSQNLTLEIFNQQLFSVGPQITVKDKSIKNNKNVKYRGRYRYMYS